MKKLKPVTLLSFVGLFFSSCFTVHAATIAVNCDANESLGGAVATAAPGDTISVSGICREFVLITTNDLTLVGDDTGSKAIISGEGVFPPGNPLTVDGAVRVVIRGFITENGIFGISARNNASVSMANVESRNNIFGVHIATNSHAKLSNIDIANSQAIGLEIENGGVVEISDTLNVSGSNVFGLEAVTGSSLKVHENAVVNSFGNLLGGQISVGASLFVDRGAAINVTDNATIGLSINTGASAILFNSELNAMNNGRDGLDVVSAASLDVDGDSIVTSNDNGREGISIDNSIVNLFGFFSQEEELPKIVANGNVQNGVLVENTSKLDIGRNSSIEAFGNGAAGVMLDDGSSAVLQSSELVDNNGKLRERDPRSADVVATFGSRVTFLQNNNVGLALCDRTSLSRGDVRCRP